MLRLTLAFYFNPIYLARQVHRITSKERITRFLGIFTIFSGIFSCDKLLPETIAPR